MTLLKENTKNILTFNPAIYFVWLDERFQSVMKVRAQKVTVGVGNILHGPSRISPYISYISLTAHCGVVLAPVLSAALNIILSCTPACA